MERLRGGGRPSWRDRVRGVHFATSWKQRDYGYER